MIVVFFHGNGATLERDVRDRQLVPQQISDSGVNAVLLAPQLAVNAADSSAGKFWQPGGFKRFIDESASHLARLYGDPEAAQTFANMPIVIVGYSGGFLPTAWSLEVGGIGNRVRGVFLLDAVYGELDKFASWIENNRSGFFVSSYTHYTKRHDDELMQMLREKGIAVTEDMDGPLRPGSVVFVETPDGVTHRDYVTHAWTEHPRQGSAGQDGGDARADTDRRRICSEPVARSGLLPDLQHDPPHHAPVRHQPHRLAGPLQRKHPVDLRAELALADPCHDLLRRAGSLVRATLHPGADEHADDRIVLEQRQVHGE